MNSSSEQVTTVPICSGSRSCHTTTLAPKTHKHLFRFLCVHLSVPLTTLPIVSYKTLVTAIPAFTLSCSLDFNSHNFLTDKGIRSTELSKNPRSTNRVLQYHSVLKLCPTLCDSMGCGLPGSSISYCLPELAQTHIHWHWLCGSQQTVENSERDGNTRPPDLPLEKPICRSGSNS